MQSDSTTSIIQTFLSELTSLDPVKFEIVLHLALSLPFLNLLALAFLTFFDGI